MPPAPSSSKTTTPPKTGKRDPHDTPAMRQWSRFKERHPECVLFFRMGDFYELFDDDAELVHRVLGLTLTQRTEGIPMAGVPHHALDGYVRRMIEGGYRVAVCDQIQDPKDAKGVVDRAVTRVLTPGTLVEESLLDEALPNQVAAILFTEGGDNADAVLAIAEVSTGRFTLLDLPAAGIVDELARLRPAELLYVETADHEPPPRVQRARDVAGCALTARPAWTFRGRDAADIIRVHFGVQTLSGFGLDDDDPAIAPAGALLRYLQETQCPEDAPNRHQLDHLQPPKREDAALHVVIDATSLASLEIERTMRTGQTAGSLMSILQRCVTPMGKRLLRHWLCFPLRDVAAIEARQRAVGALVADRDGADALAGELRQVQDVARIVARTAMFRATPRDVVALGRSLARMDGVLEHLAQRPAFAPQHDRLAALRDALVELGETILRRCVDEPPAHLRDGGLFRDGIDSELDESHRLQRDANSWLAEERRTVHHAGTQGVRGEGPHRRVARHRARAHVV